MALGRLCVFFYASPKQAHSSYLHEARVSEALTLGLNVLVQPALSQILFTAFNLFFMENSNLNLGILSANSTN